MTTSIDRVYFRTATVGTGALAVGNAFKPYYRNLSTAYAHGDVADGDIIGYAIQDGDSWEVGKGTVASSGAVLERTTVLRTDDGGTSPLSLSGNADVLSDTTAATMTELLALLDIVKTNGAGDKYLADDGTYKTVTSGGQVDSVVAGANVSVDNTDPVNPVVSASITGGGDMSKVVYDPTGVEADAFARANHTGTQTLSTISDAGDAAALDVGIGAGDVAAGDHNHAGVYDPAGSADAAVAGHESAYDHGELHDHTNKPIIDQTTQGTIDHPANTVPHVSAQDRMDWDANMLGDLTDVDVPTPTDGYRLAWDELQQLWVPKQSSSGLGIIQLSYKWDTPVNPTPNDKEMSRTAINEIAPGTPGEAATLYFNKLNANGVDTSPFFEEMQDGQWLNLYDPGDVTVFEKYNITGPAVEVADVFEVPVTVYEVAGPVFTDKKLLSIFWRTIAPDNRLPSGGLPGQVLGKVSAGDYDTDWIDAASVPSVRAINQATTPADIIVQPNEIVELTPNAAPIGVSFAAIPGGDEAAHYEVKIFGGSSAITWTGPVAGDWPNGNVPDTTTGRYSVFCERTASGYSMNWMAFQ